MTDRTQREDFSEVGSPFLFAVLPTPQRPKIKRRNTCGSSRHATDNIRERAHLMMDGMGMVMPKKRVSSSVKSGAKAWKWDK